MQWITMGRYIMFRNRLVRLGVPAVAVALVLWTGSLSMAAGHGGGHGGHGGGNAGHAGGHGGNGNGGHNHHGGGFYPYLGFGYYPGYGGYGYAPSNYDYSAYPSSYQSFYPSASPALASPVVTLNVRVPASADVWLNGTPVATANGFQQYASPPLTPGQNYTYDVKARWMENGQAVEQTRQLTVHAGDVLNVNFTAPAPR